MSQVTEHAATYWPLLIYALCVLGIVFAMLLCGYFLGGRNQSRLTGEPYEAGMIPVGDSRLRFSAKYYLVAIFFVVFDLEAVFILAWGVAARKAGWLGYAEAMIFVGVLTLTLVYVWRIGALDWAPKKSTSLIREQQEKAARQSSSA